MTASKREDRCRCCHRGQPCECCPVHAGDRERDELLTEIADGAGSYGAAWQTSALLALIRKQADAAADCLLDGHPTSARERVKDIASLALALAMSLPGEGSP